MAIDRETVVKVAQLARLALSEDEITRLTKDLGSIFGHIDKLQQLDTAGVEPMAHAASQDNVFRDDTSRPSLPQAKALAAGPDTDEEFFRVPPVLE
jgi:aspartyl-tRNA(Asn)/glutamyl-tRNA(Gln) amidotransferase subunit C